MNSNRPEHDTVGGGFIKVEIEGMQNVKVAILKLHEIWNELGLEDNQKDLRSKTVWSHVHNLIQEISDEEHAYCEEVKERIQNYTKRIEELSKALRVTPKKPQGPLIKKEEMLREELDSLTKLKTQRLKAYQDLKTTEIKYCQILKTSQRESSNFEVPTENDILELQQHISMLEAEKNRRYAEFCRLKTELTTILEETDLEPETLHEREIVYSRESIPLSNETFKTLEEMISRSQRLKTQMEAQKKTLLTKLFAWWERLKLDESEKTRFLLNHSDFKGTTLRAIEEELEKVKKENLKMFIDILKAELEDLWSKACISDCQKPDLKSYCSAEPTDQVLDEYEAEVEKWRAYIGSVSHILEKIQKRQRLFDMLLNFDQKAKDPNRFKNRKGNLLKEERERSKLQKDLPALETDILHDIEIYESENGAPFLYFGEDFRVVVTAQWSERTGQNDNVKLERHKRQLLQLQTDKVVGTPPKGQLLTTPKSAPNQKRIVISKFRTPGMHCSKTTPKTVGRLGSKCGKLFSSQKKEPKPVVIATDDLPQTSRNTTTYTDFAAELNTTKRHKLRSSVLATKKPGGTRIPLTNKKTDKKCTLKLTPGREK